jgi:arabinogalactan endo-1,4-beta-galactosidase
MILEVAYLWTVAFNDSYPNLFGSQTPVGGYPYTVDDQYRFMKDLTQKVIAAGGDGLFYWEPAWISSQLLTQWGTGSAWENACLFDFDGNALNSINYMTYPYTFPTK